MVEATNRYQNVYQGGQGRGLVREAEEGGEKKEGNI